MTCVNDRSQWKEERRLEPVPYPVSYTHLDVYKRQAVGCTGGQHRSVALAESTGDYLKTKGYRVSIAHRDLALAEGCLLYTSRCV